MFLIRAIVIGPFVVAVRCVTLFIQAIIVSSKMIAAIRKWRDKKAPTHGDAALMGFKELKRHGHFNKEGWLVGMFEGKPVYLHPESSGLAMAPKGQGKTQTAICQLRRLTEKEIKPDVIVVDPAGDLSAATRDGYRQAGYTVREINFIDPTRSETYDPFSYLRPYMVYDFDRQVDQLCHLIMPDDAHTREAHFQEFSRILLAGTIAYLVQNKPEEATLYRAAELLTTDATRRKEMFTAMRKSTNAIVRQAVSAFDEAGDKEKGSFSTTMTRKLKVWLRQSVKALTETGEIDAMGRLVRGWTWEEVYNGDTPTITYIRTGLGTDEGAAARLILGNAINTRRYLWNETGRKPDRELRILVDEAVTIGNCQAIVDANNELRKAGVTVMLWFLSMRDVFQTYSNAKTLVNNSDLFVFGGGKEMDNYEDCSRMIGEKTIENPGYSTSDNGASQSASEQARRVVKADELRRQPFEKMIAILGANAGSFDKPFKITKRNELVYL